MKDREGPCSGNIKIRTFPKVRERRGTHRIKTITLELPKGRPPALAVTLTASRLPFLKRFGQTLGDLSQQVLSLVQQAQGVCQ